MLQQCRLGRHRQKVMEIELWLPLQREEGSPVRDAKAGSLDASPWGLFNTELGYPQYNTLLRGFLAASHVYQIVLKLECGQILSTGFSNVSFAGPHIQICFSRSEWGPGISFSDHFSGNDDSATREITH